MLDVTLLKKFDIPLPRYTSYPTVPCWTAMSDGEYIEELKKLQSVDQPLSLYIHIPFCHSMCLYCACSVVLNRKRENEQKYVEYLLKEIALVAGVLGKKKRVAQLHFGGGTPTKLFEDDFKRLFYGICDFFSFTEDAEIAIEVDPRSVLEENGRKLEVLRTLGFNRLSFGVQDTDDTVQKAIRRNQSREMTRKMYRKAEELGFSGINIDLIYGLPYQTRKTFAKTVDDVCQLSPDRIALFSYAKVPWLKPHQKAMKDETLPSVDEKFLIYAEARERFLQEGYQVIGMDHFAKKEDQLVQAFKEKKLYRNFQGYTVFDAPALLGFGMTSIGYTETAYFQNVKTIDEYYQAIDKKQLPVQRGKCLTQDDIIRKWVIQKIMCHGFCDKKEFFTLFKHDFDTYFSHEKKELSIYREDGFFEETDDILTMTEKGMLFLRNIASIFDVYLQKKDAHKGFSKAI